MHDDLAGTDEARLADAALAAAVFATDAAALGGVLFRGDGGPLRDCWLQRVKSYLRTSAPVRRLPSHITDDRLLGGLDLAATLAAGRPLAERGLLAEADGGILVVPGAEALPSALAARLASALDLGKITLERDGLAQDMAARFGIVALDDGIEDDARTPAALADRLGLHVDVMAMRRPDLGEAIFSHLDIERASQAYRNVGVSDDMIAALCTAAAALGVASLNAPLLAVRVCRILAALDGRTEASNEDAAVAARLVIAPRATCFPVADNDKEEQSEPEPPGDNAGQPDDETQNKPLDDMVVNAAKAAIPPHLLALLQSRKADRSRWASSGRAGAVKKAPRRGRPAGIRRGKIGDGGRLNVVETLRAAAPWQNLRRAERARREHVPMSARVEVTPDDFRIRRLKHRAETATIFIVDASGSTAVQRLAEAKGAVELLLADCYSRRDHVALIAFSGRGAQVLLPPTRSLARAKRNLADLPGGGGTPLASGIEAAVLICEAVARKGQTPGIVMLTDGRANIGRDGQPGRAAAETDAITAARELRARKVPALLVDTSTKPQPAAARIAEAMGAVYLPLPHADAHTLSTAVKAEIAGRQS